MANKKYTTMDELFLFVLPAYLGANRFGGAMVGSSIFGRSKTKKEDAKSTKKMLRVVGGWERRSARVGRVQDVVPSFGATIGTIKKSRHCLIRLWRDNFSHNNEPKTCGHSCGCKGEDVRSGWSTGGTNESFFETIVISRTNNNKNKIKSLLPVMLFSIISLYNIT